MHALSVELVELITGRCRTSNELIELLGAKPREKIGISGQGPAEAAERFVEGRERALFFNVVSKIR